MKIAIMLLALIALVACSTATTNVISPINMAESPTFTLKIENDTERLSGNISKRIQELGLRSLSDTSSQPDYYVKVSYKTYWDVAYQTFSRFEIAFVDAKTNESKVTSRYVGRVGLNSCNAALDIVFEDLAAKLERKR